MVNNPMKCYFCGEQVIWSSDWDYDDIWGEGEGIVSIWICSKCGAEHQFTKRFDEEGEGV